MKFISLSCFSKSSVTCFMFPIIMGVTGLGSMANSMVPLKNLQFIFINAVSTVVIFPSANCRLTLLFV